MYDLLSYLVDEYKKENPSDADSEAINKFAEHSRTVLRKNQPISAGQVGGSFGVHLQDSTQLPFCANDDVSSQMQGTPHVAVTQGDLGQHTQPGQAGMQSNFAVEVTKGEADTPEHRRV